ncbi:MAG TPA: ABC transporter substrate-binding protein [Clostridia bacterium]|nr:ABC transporter substrate-binding protein [Clostridia bacterium]
MKITVSVKALVLALVLCLGLAQVPALAAESPALTLKYPEIMQAKGYTEPLVLNAMPERIVVMTNTPVLALYEMGVPMVAIPATSVVTWPEDLLESAALLNTAMNANFDIETVIALDPDLVMLGYTSQETYGKILTDAGIPVYYLDAGHTVSYESIKQQTEVLIETFGLDDGSGQGILARFDELEARLESAKATFAGKTVMVLQSSPPSHYIQTKAGTLGSMADMLGLTNVYENDQASMVLIDYETALEYDPDIVLAVGGSKTAEEHRALMEDDFAKNEAYWNAIRAIREGDVVYLPVSYVASAGIYVIDTVNALLDTLEAKLAE